MTFKLSPGEQPRRYVLPRRLAIRFDMVIALLYASLRLRRYVQRDSAYKADAGVDSQ
jgi:hypothetical protein